MKKYRKNADCLDISIHSIEKVKTYEIPNFDFILNNKKSIILVVFLHFLLLAKITLYAQQSTFQKVFGLNIYDVNAVVPNSSSETVATDNNIACFSAQLANPIKYDIVLLKLDSIGNNINHKALAKNSNFHDWITGVIQDGNSNYAVGSSRGFDTTSFSYESSYLLKFDRNLNILSQTNYFLSNRELFAKAVTMTSDHNLLTAGASTFGNNWSFFILKTDTIGNIIWYKQYNTTKSIDIGGIRELQNGDILIAGSYAYGFETIMPTALRFTSDGDCLWGRVFIYDTTPFSEQNSTLKFIKDYGNNKILLAGQTDYSGIAANGFMDSYVLMIEGDGNLVWSNTYGEFQHDWPYNYSITQNQQLAITGGTGSFFNNSNYGFIQFIDSTGTLISSFAFGDNSIQESIALSGYRELSHNESIVHGFKKIGNNFNFYTAGFNSINAGSCPLNQIFFQKKDASSYPTFDFIAMVDSTLMPYTSTDTFSSYQGITDSTLCSSIPSSINHETGLEFSLSLFPNPSNQQLTVSFSNNLNFEDAKIMICDTYGKVIYNQEYNRGNSLSITVADYPPGLYCISIHKSDKIITGKFIKADNIVK